MALLDALTAQVTQTTTVEQSAITIIQGLAKEIATLSANSADPAQVAALAQELNASATALSAAITANTPPPAPTPTPTPAPTA